jgi:hypothetical protein
LAFGGELTGNEETCALHKLLFPKKEKKASPMKLDKLILENSSAGK